MPVQDRFRQAFRVVFHFDEQARLNLFEAFPALERFFADRRHFAWVRTLGDVLFTTVILFGLFGPQDPERNISLFLAWGVWWTSVVLSWFLVGRLWCGACPFPGVGRILRRLGISFNRDVPRFLQKKGLYLSTFLLGVIIWSESVFNLKTSPAGTAVLLIAIITGVTLLEVLYKGQAWCRHLCPMGRIIGAAATLSITEFRPDHGICRSCTTAVCRKGIGAVPGCPVYLGAVNVRNNLDCLVCGHCVSLCPHGSPRINLRSPFIELLMNKGRYLTCSYIIPLLMGSQLARFLEDKQWFMQAQPLFPGVHLVVFSGLLALGFLLFLGMIRLGARLFAVTEDEVFGKFSPFVPVLIPMAFAGELAYRLRYLLPNLGNFLPVFGRQFGLDLSWLGFAVNSGLVTGLSFLTLVTGAAACHQVLRLLRRGDFEGMVPPDRYVALHLLILAVWLAYVLLL